ncbi:MAG: class I SAM-dependent methyltransferase [Acidiferrobacterales bacterium]
MADNPSYDPEAYRDFEHAAWAKLPQTYQEHFGFLTAQAAEPMLDAVGTASGVRLLEVACGTGYVSAAAMVRGAIPVGIDFVAGMVTEARNRHPSIEFREGDAEALPFVDESFDAVVCNFGLHHFGRPEQAMAEAYRVLAPGGRYAFTVWFPPDEVRLNLRQVVRAAVETHGDPHRPLPSSPPEFSDLQESKQALLAIGFADAIASKLAIMGRWSKADHVLDTLYKGMGRTKALVEAQTDEARKKIENAILEVAKRFEKDGIIEIPMPAMLACARKPSRNS